MQHDASAVVLDYADAVDSAMANVITAVGVPRVPAVGIVSAFAGIPTAANVLNTVDVPGIPAFLARVFAIAAIHTALDVHSATCVSKVSGVPAFVGIPARVVT